MSVAGYIGKNRRVPRIREEHTDSVGIRYHGPEQLVREEEDARNKRDVEVYDSVGDYDPVLRAHCRLWI